MVAELQARSQEMAAEEELIADARARFEAEQLIEFYDLLSLNEVRTEIVPLMSLETKRFSRPTCYALLPERSCYMKPNARVCLSKL